MQQEAPVKNRWLMALCAVCIHLPLGSIYAYSVLILPLFAERGWSRASIMAAFSLAILLLGFSAAFLGPRVQRLGPGRAARLAALLYVSGLLLASAGVKLGFYPLFLLGYGAVSGVGLGVGYVTPVTTLLLWFPDRKGLATGMAVMGFGFGSLAFGPVLAWLIARFSVWPALAVLAAVYGAMMLAASLYFAPPPKGWRPAGFAPPPAEAHTGAAPSRAVVAGTLKSRRFLSLWLMLFINISCGIGVIAMASPMAQETAGLSAMQAAALIGLMGLCNGAGRFCWAALSDYAGRPLVFMSFFILQAAAFCLLAASGSALLFQAMLLLIVSCYGGGFALLPAFLSDMFGTSRVTSVFGYALTAWGVAGIVGPNLGAAFTAWSGSYQAVLYLYAAMMALGGLVACLLWLNLRREQDEPSTEK